MDNRKPTWKELLVQALIAALTAVATALTATSCMGYGPVNL